jgi:hypothetical protein
MREAAGWRVLWCLSTPPSALDGAFCLERFAVCLWSTLKSWLVGDDVGALHCVHLNRKRSRDRAHHGRAIAPAPTCALPPSRRYALIWTPDVGSGWGEMARQQRLFVPTGPRLAWLCCPTGAGNQQHSNRGGVATRIRAAVLRAMTGQLAPGMAADFVRLPLNSWATAGPLRPAGCASFLHAQQVICHHCRVV